MSESTTDGQGTPKDFIFKRGTDAYIPDDHDPRGTVIDRSLFEQEDGLLRARLEAARIGYLQALSGCDAATRSKIAGFDTSIRTEFRRLHSGPIARIREVVSGDRSASIAEMTAYRVIIIGSMLASSEAHRRRNTELGKLDTDPSGDIKKYLDLLYFASLGGADLKIGSVSLSDFVRQGKDRLPTSSIARYFVEALRVYYRTGPQSHAVENNTFPAVDFPTLTAAKIDNFVTDFLSSYNLLGKGSAPEFTRLRREYPDYYERAQNLLKQMNSFLKRLNETVFDPSDPEFISVREMAEEYLDMDRGTRLMAIHFFSHGTDQALIELYRNGRRLMAGSNGHSEFYRKLSEAVAEYADMSRPILELAQYDDVETIFFPDQTTSTQSPPTFDTLRALAGDITSNTQQRRRGDRTKPRYEINCASIEDWGGLVSPQSAAIEFDEARPNHFFVKISYSNEMGEEIEVKLDIDTKRPKPKFDWNFLESPDDERMQAFHSALFIATQSILEQIRDRVVQEYAERRAERGAKMAPPVPRVPRGPKERPKPEEVSPTKRRQQPDSSLKDLFADPQAEERTRVKQKIILPEESEDLMRMMPRGLQVSEFESIMKDIQAFNDTEGLLGYIKDVTDTNLLVLRVGGRKFRIILQDQSKDESTNKTGQRNLKIIRIDRRRDVYKGVFRL